MDAVAIINAIAAAVKVAVDVGPSVIKAVEDAEPFATAIYDLIVKGTQITQADLDALEAKVDELADELLEPLPPE